MAVGLASLWLPILLSGVAVFFLSFVMWMVLNHHQKDWSKAPDEDALMEALRAQGLNGGAFSFPYCDDKKMMSDPDFQKKYTQGPSGILLLRRAGPSNMGALMGVSALFNVVVSLLVAYVLTIAFTDQAAGVDVFRTSSTVAFLAYGGAQVWGSIWYSKPWGTLARELFDSLVYGLGTALVFMLMWPSPSV